MISATSAGIAGTPSSTSTRYRTIGPGPATAPRPAARTNRPRPLSGTGTTLGLAGRSDRLTLTSVSSAGSVGNDEVGGCTLERPGGRESAGSVVGTVSESAVADASGVGASIRTPSTMGAMNPFIAATIMPTPSARTNARKTTRAEERRR